MKDELKQKQKNLMDEIQDDVLKGLDVTICHQHRRILYHTQDLVTGLADAMLQKTCVFSVLRRNWSQFNDSLLKSQKNS